MNLEITMNRRVGLVLAGGVGRRLGRTKGDLVFDGQPLALRAARVLEPLCDHVLISVRPGAENPAPGYAAIEDPPPAGRGPLAGIHAAYAATCEADLLILPCDYPRLRTEVLERLLAKACPEDDLVILVAGDGRDHPLIGLWRGRNAASVLAALRSGRFAVRHLLREREVRRLGPADFPSLDLDSVLLNVNRPTDL
jgi:molybdopterin-guanine dinucleotide biosynthesis protein A